MRKEWVGQYLDALDQIDAELALYPDETKLFEVLPGTLNSGGNLFLHLIGNLRHFYGAILLKDGYVRMREEEFSGTATLSEIKADLMLVRGLIQVYFNGASDESFDQPFPIEFAGAQVTHGFMYLKLLQHLTYHIGQINYHRRVVCAS